MTLTLYFNPRCSKSRQAVALLEERDVPFSLVDYLAVPPTAEGLDRLRELLGGHEEMVRRKEPEFAELGLQDAAWDELRAAIVAHPRLLERPIAVLGDRAVIARPPEKLLQLL